jgi:hypothetical protein
MLAGPGRRRTRPLQAVRTAPRAARCGAARTAGELVPIAGYYGRLVSTQESLGPGGAWGIGSGLWAIARAFPPSHVPTHFALLVHFLLWYNARR